MRASSIKTFFTIQKYCSYFHQNRKLNFKFKYFLESNFQRIKTKFHFCSLLPYILCGRFFSGINFFQNPSFYYRKNGLCFFVCIGGNPCQFKKSTGGLFC